MKNKNLYLDKEGVKITNEALNNPIFNDVSYIYSSDYTSSKQTANILARRLNKKVIIDKKRYCVKYNDCYKFNDNVFFDGKWNYCEVIKLTFD